MFAKIYGDNKNTKVYEITVVILLPIPILVL